MKKYLPIYSTRLASILIQEGFSVLEIRPNIYNPKKKVFFFEDCQKTQKIKDEYYQIRQKEKEALIELKDSRLIDLLSSLGCKLVEQESGTFVAKEEPGVLDIVTGYNKRFNQK